jgi:hypothetical protein
MTPFYGEFYNLMTWFAELAKLPPQVNSCVKKVMAVNIST